MHRPSSFAANRRGALAMLLAMAGFAVEDMAIKAAARDLPTGEVLTISGLLGLGLFALWARAGGQPPFHPSVTRPLMLLRSVSEVGGRLFFALAITLTPISSASAILQATPLVVALGAVLFFGETVSARRWLAIAAGFAGVLMIIRPGLAGFAPASVFAVLGTLGFAGRDLITRASPLTMTTAQLGTLGFSMLTLAGAVLPAAGGGGGWPQPLTCLYLGASAGFGALAYAALMIAMRSGEISVVAPFRYSRLLFALAIGTMVFGERPDGLTLLGSAIIVASGLALIGRPAR